MAPDGRSLITSVGTAEGTVWLQDAGGDRQISSEGYAEAPSLSADGTRLFYLVRLRGRMETSSGNPFPKVGVRECNPNPTRSRCPEPRSWKEPFFRDPIGRDTHSPSKVSTGTCIASHPIRAGNAGSDGPISQVFLAGKELNRTALDKVLSNREAAAKAAARQRALDASVEPSAWPSEPGNDIGLVDNPKLHACRDRWETQTIRLSSKRSDD
jgi:hypothetical protein